MAWGKLDEILIELTKKKNTSKSIKWMINKKMFICVIRRHTDRCVVCQVQEGIPSSSAGSADLQQPPKLYGFGQWSLRKM